MMTSKSSSKTRAARAPRLRVEPWQETISDLISPSGHPSWGLGWLWCAVVRREIRDASELNRLLDDIRDVVVAVLLFS